MTASLSERLRSETRELHVRAERSPYMAALLRGQMARAPYLALLRHLQAIYGVLEPALRRHATYAPIAALDLAGLQRAPSLAEDLAAFGEGLPAPMSIEALQPAGRRYIERLQQIGSQAPKLLLAHAYVRYLGDLSGGQAIGRIVARSMQLPSIAGIAFYDFGDATAVAAKARAFRAALDTVAVADHDSLIAEAKAAFVAHRELFDELASAFDLGAR